MPACQHVTFKLVEGRIVHGGQYYDDLCAKFAKCRPKAKTSLLNRGIRPSHLGTPTEKLVTIWEGFNYLEVKCSLQFAGNYIDVDLKAVILGYIGMIWASECSHPASDCLRFSKSEAISTSVAAPSGQDVMGVAMVRYDAVAQFLCCENGYQAVLQKDCCLNCALGDMVPRSYIVIIVG